MAITVEEKIQSRSGDSTRKELAYIISGTEDHGEALGELLGEAPATFSGLTRNDLACGVDLVPAALIFGKARSPT